MPTASIARQVKAFRTAQKITAEQLAEQMRALGVPFDKTVIANLETGRRRFVTVQELFALSKVLRVAVVNLMVPIDDEATPFQIADGVTVPPEKARRWIRGQTPLSDADGRLYFGQVPEPEAFWAQHGEAIEAGGDGSWVHLRDDRGRRMFDDRGWQISYDEGEGDKDGS